MKFFDCCAGIGSAHLAFKNLGLDCVGYSEIDKNYYSVLTKRVLNEQSQTSLF